jgi:hypothetical protein
MVRDVLDIASRLTVVHFINELRQYLDRDRCRLGRLAQLRDPCSFGPVPGQGSFRCPAKAALDWQGGTPLPKKVWIWLSHCPRSALMHSRRSRTRDHHPSDLEDARGQE